MGRGLRVAHLPGAGASHPGEVADVEPHDNSGWLVRWLEPGEVFRIRSDDDGDELAFLITCRVNEEDRAAGIENVSVWIEAGDCWAVQVTDRSGNVIECGHHRPEEIHTKWAAATDEARRRMTERQALRNS